KEKKLDFLLDVGCGGGQSVNIFAPYFHEVLAIDPSENQIKEARSQNKFAHVTYKAGFAEKLPCDDVSVDVIIAGASVHWFDRQKFYEEADRVLKPGGRLVMFGYWSPKLVPLGLPGDVTRLSEIGSQLIHDAYLFGAKWNPDVKEVYLLIYNKYTKIFNEIKYAKKLRLNHFTEGKAWSLTDVKGLIQSIDSYEPYMKRSDKSKISEQFVRSLKESWGCTGMENSDVKMKVIFNFFVIVADKP
uniref:Methyltransferase type 11 domain-containing protein n=1 Tax=Ciona intestinalis TaxID=7719 RepID=H2XVH5_CIOIN